MKQRNCDLSFEATNNKIEHIGYNLDDDMWFYSNGVKRFDLFDSCSIGGILLKNIFMIDDVSLCEASGEYMFRLAELVVSIYGSDEVKSEINKSKN